jgi:hypothetical protein
MRYASLGFVLVSEMAFASLTVGYAFNLVSVNPFLNACLALLWGVMIFSLDRILMQSISPRIHWTRRFTRIMPRFVLSALFALLTGTCVTIGIFRQELDRFNREMPDHAVRRIDEQLAAYKVEIPALERRLVDAETRVNDALQEYLEEVDGTASGLAGMGPVAELKRQRYEEAEAELRRLRPLLTDQIQSKTASAAAISSRRDELLAQTNSTDLLARLSALRALSKQEPAVNIARFGITVLLFLLSSSPFLIKLLELRSSYDQLAEIEVDALRVPPPQESAEVKRINEATQNAFGLALEQSELNPKHTGV